METKSISFEIDRSYSTKLPKLIETNFEEMKEFLIEQTKKDYEIVVDKDNFLSSKDRCTLLNKQYELIDSERKNIKKDYLKAYNDFESKCKELLNIISSARDSIWGQITSIEDNYDQTRKNALETEFNELIGNYVGLRSFEKIWDKKWLSKAKENTCHKELKEKVENVKKEIDVIIKTSGEYKNAMLANYAMGMDFADVVTLIDKCKEIEKSYDTTNEDKPPFEVEEDLFTFTLAFEVTGTQNQILELRKYLTNNGIKFNKVK